MRSVPRAAVSRGAVIALLALSPAPGTARAGVSIALTPTVQTVAPGAEFEVVVQVTQAGSAFNGFDLVVEFDPAVLTPVPRTPLASQVGTLVTAACPTLFHRFAAGASSDTANCVMLCSGASVTGPGPIYRLRFRASSAVQATYLRFGPGTAFFGAGALVPGLEVHGAAVGIGMPVTLGVGEGRSGRMLAVSPNPSRGPATIDFGAPLPTHAVLRVHDLQGRTVRSLRLGAGERTVTWDGRDAGGRRVAPGHYVLALEGRTAHGRGRVTIAP